MSARSWASASCTRSCPSSGSVSLQPDHQFARESANTSDSSGAGYLIWHVHWLSHLRSRRACSGLARSGWPPYSGGGCWPVKTAWEVTVPRCSSRSVCQRNERDRGHLRRSDHITSGWCGTGGPLRDPDCAQIGRAARASATHVSACASSCEPAQLRAAPVQANARFCRWELVRRWCWMRCAVSMGAALGTDRRL